jgi:hypothetical protein
MILVNGWSGGSVGRQEGGCVMWYGGFIRILLKGIKALDEKA